MESSIPWSTLKQHSLKFQQQYLLCAKAKNLELTLEQQVVDHTVQQIHSGSYFNVAICGATNSGKSTALNYLLGHESGEGKLDSRLFLTGSEAETSTSWLLTQDRHLSTDTIEVNHVAEDGSRSSKVKFTDLEVYREHLKATYSRKVVNQIKNERKNLANPFRQVHINYGLPFDRESSRLYNPLLAMGINLFDLQGLNEPGSDLTLRALPKPFVLIYCFDYSTAPFSTVHYKQLETILQTSEPSHIIFVCTQVSHTLKKIHQINSKAKEQPFDFSSLIADLETRIRNYIKLPQENYSLYFFEPNSKFETLSLGADQIRRRLLELRTNLRVELRFHQKMSIALLNQLKKLKNDLYIYALKKTKNTMFSLKWEENKKEIEKGFHDLDAKLQEKIKRAIPKQLPKKIRKLVAERKDVFLVDGPSIAGLEERLNSWFLNDGFQIALVELLKERIKKFKNVEDEEISKVFQEVLKDLNLSEDSNPLTSSQIDFSFLNSSIFLGVQSGNTIVEKIVISPFLYGIGSQIYSLAMTCGRAVASVWDSIKQFRPQTQVIDFDAVVEKWLANIMVVVNDLEMINKLCKSAAQGFLEMWGKNYQQKLSVLFLQLYEIETESLNTYLTENGFDMANLQELEKEIKGLIEL